MKKILDFKTLIAIIGIIIPIVFFVKTQKVKELSFKNIALTELVSEKDITDEAIKVYFDDTRVLNLYSVSCLLTNSGNEPITKSDFTNEFIISFPDSVKILKYSIKTNPVGINILECSIADNEFKILPDLLNQNETIEFSFYISSTNKDLLPSTNARLVGGEILNLRMDEEIKSKTDFKNRTFFKFEGFIFWCAFIYSIFYLIIFLYAIYFQKGTGIESALARFFMFLLLSFGILCNIFYLIQTKF